MQINFCAVLVSCVAFRRVLRDWMRRAREGGGSAWTARAPLASFPDARKDNTEKKNKRTERQKRNALVFAGSQGPLGS